MRVTMEQPRGGGGGERSEGVLGKHSPPFMEGVVPFRLPDRGGGLLLLVLLIKTLLGLLSSSVEADKMLFIPICVS